MMQAAFFTGKEKLDVRDTPKPVLPKGGMIVRVAYAAICGTDLKTLKQSDVKMEDGKQRFMELPRIIGHEFSGTVELSDPDIKDFSKGDRVVIFPTISCGKCYYCKIGRNEMCDKKHVVGYDCDGGFAEYTSISSKIVAGGGIIKIPDYLPLDIAAIAEPFSCAINCFELTPIPHKGSVVIIGAGPLGAFLCENARLNGAGMIILLEKNEQQLKTARIAPADSFLLNQGDKSITEIKNITNGRGADVVVTACSAPSAQLQAINMVAKCGKVNLFGGLPRDKSILSIDTNMIHYKECMVTGTHGSCPEQAKKALAYFKDTIDMEKYISKKYPLFEINNAFENAMGSNRMKILIEME